MTHKITKAHIQDLYNFTRQHYVEHYDLQTELVDHLANDIQAIWETQPELTFEQAKQQSFKKFGVFGFMEVAEERQKAMNKRYLRFLWKELKAWFNIPKLVITLTLFICFYVAFTMSISKWLFLAGFGLGFVLLLYKTIDLHLQFKKRRKLSHKKWLLEDLIFKQAGTLGILFVPQVFNVFMYTEDFGEPLNYPVIMAVIFTLVAILFYVCFEILPGKAEILLKETYPEYSL